MNYKAHRIGGICAGAIAGIALTDKIDMTTIPMIYTLAMASGIGSLLPDVDQGDSYVGQMIFPLSKLIQFIFGHRKLIHSPIWNILIIWAMFHFAYLIPPGAKIVEMVVFTVLCFIMFGDHPRHYLIWMVFNIVMMLQMYALHSAHGLFILLATGLSLGIISHLLFDMMTVSGIPLLFPFIGRTFSIMKLRTNRHEIIVIFMAIIALIMVIGFKYLNFKPLILKAIYDKIKTG